MTSATNTPPNQPSGNQSNDELVYGFVAAVSHLLMPDEFKGTALYKFLHRFARQWHIAHVDLDDVVFEGVKRGVEYILRHGQPIKKPEAWLRQVCLNILRGLVDTTVKEKRKSAMATDLIQPLCNPMITSELIEQLEYLEVAIGRLSQEDQALIRMKFIHGKTYEQIRQHYKYIAEAEWVAVPSVQTLRKRESRALKRLRNAFLELYKGGASKST